MIASINNRLIKKLIPQPQRSWARLLKAAKIENFTWHDMRHDDASQLALT
jgi:hypothetical protein